MKTNHLDEPDLAEQITHYQLKLFPFAYNILGNSLEAEDVVQETLNNFFLNTHSQVEHQDRYLTRSVINRAINQKKLLRNKREEYPGQWLPTPISTEEGIYAQTDSRQILRYSLLVLLENLNPRERAVFILKETFDFSHHEIADILDMTVENSRQLLKRGKQKLAPDTLPPLSDNRESQAIIHRLTEAILHTDIEEVKNLLTSEVQSISDGGTKARAARKIIFGRKNVYKFLKAIYSKYQPSETSARLTTINHHPAILFFYRGMVFRCVVFELEDRAISKIFIMVNPDKLQHLNFSD